MTTGSARDVQTVVVGAGIAGLTAAYRLQAAGRRVRVLEASDRVGGVIRSARVGGHLFELGPNTVPSTAPRLGRLIDDLAAVDPALRAATILSRPQAGRRLVWRRAGWFGRGEACLHALPESPPGLLRCTALGPWAKLRLLAEPLIPARAADAPPETLGAFGRRRLGRGAVDAFLDPFVTGVFAGRLDRLGVDALPRLAELEAAHGSLLRGLIASRRAGGRARRAGSEGDAAPGPPPLLSFVDGLEQLPRALERALGEAVTAGSRVVRVEPDGPGFRVVWADRDDTARGDTVRGDTGSDDTERELLARDIVVATPAATAARLLEPTLDDPESAAWLASIPHPFVATVCLGYRRSDVTHPLDAFGVLIASDSRLPPEADALGVLFPSSIFDGRSPTGEVALTVMLGGARDPAAATLDDDALVARARAAVERLVGARGEPTAVALARWPRAIPQFLPGHGARVTALRAKLEALATADDGRRGRLAIAGNCLDGVGVEGAVASGDAAAAAVLGAQLQT